MAERVGQNQGGGLLQRMLPQAACSRLSKAVHASGDFFRYEYGRAKRVFTLNPNVKHFKDLYEKYFPEGLFPEAEAITRLRTRLAEISFSNTQERAAFLEREQSIEALSYLHEDRAPIPISPEAFQAIALKKHSGQDASFEEVLSYMGAVSDREDRARAEEIAELTRGKAAALIKEASDEEQQANETGEQAEAVRLRGSAAKKREEAARLQAQADEVFQTELLARLGREEGEDVEAIIGESEKRRLAKETLMQGKKYQALFAEGAVKALEAGNLKEFSHEVAEYLAAELRATEKGKHLMFMGKAGTEIVGLKGLLNVPGLKDKLPLMSKPFFPRITQKHLVNLSKATLSNPSAQ